VTYAQLAGLASAILGTMGTVVLFFNSYALQPFEGGVFGSDALTASNNAVRTANAKRVVRQRIGLASLCVSFAVQAVAVFL
jgi:hypothetical protein